MKIETKFFCLLVLSTLGASIVNAEDSSIKNLGRSYGVVLKINDRGADPLVTTYRVYYREKKNTKKSSSIDSKDYLVGLDGNLSLIVKGIGLSVRGGPYCFRVAAIRNGIETSKSAEKCISYKDASVVIDSDGDGLVDSEEDINLNMEVEPTETDPFQIDSDSDGVGDFDDECPLSVSNGKLHSKQFLVTKRTFKGQERFQWDAMASLGIGVYFVPSETDLQITIFNRNGEKKFSVWVPKEAFKGNKSGRKYRFRNQRELEIVFPDPEILKGLRLLGIKSLYFVSNSKGEMRVRLQIKNSMLDNVSQEEELMWSLEGMDRGCGAAKSDLGECSTSKSGNRTQCVF